MLFFLMSLSSFAQNDDTKMADKDKFIETVKFLEETPLAENVQEKRSWALKYSNNIETLDCDPITSIFLAKEVSGEVLAQYLLKLASFSLENPNIKDIKLAQFIAVESALKVYIIVLEKNPKTRTKYIDILVNFQKAGKLKKELEAVKCKKIKITI